jgi:hypothetical protein
LDFEVFKQHYNEMLLAYPEFPHFKDLPIGTIQSLKNCRKRIEWIEEQLPGFIKRSQERLRNA